MSFKIDSGVGWKPDSKRSGYWVTADISDYVAEIERLTAAVKFMTVLADEEYGHARVGTGAEVALRHIIRRGREVLGL